MDVQHEVLNSQPPTRAIGGGMLSLRVMPRGRLHRSKSSCGADTVGCGPARQHDVELLTRGL